jgi:hypothetical protein
MANKKVTPLTDTAIKTAKPRVELNPAVTLAKARAKPDELKSKVLNGIDPI